MSGCWRSTGWFGRGSPSAVTPESAKRNVAHHYDLDAGLFELFLDADRQYSCAYFETPEQSLEEAQLAKKRHIAAKLLLEPDLHVLDIGSRLGRARALSRRGRPASASPASRCRKSSWRSPGSAPATSAASASVSGFRLEDYRQVDRHVRPDRLGRHVRACRPAKLCGASSERRRRCWSVKTE